MIGSSSGNRKVLSWEAAIQTAASATRRIVGVLRMAIAAYKSSKGLHSVQMSFRVMPPAPSRRLDRQTIERWRVTSYPQMQALPFLLHLIS